MKNVIPCSLLVLLFSVNAFAEELASLVQQNISLVASIVEKNEDLSVATLQPKIDEVLANLINFDTISLGVMGKYQKDATLAQSSNCYFTCVEKRVAG